MSLDANRRTLLVALFLSIGLWVVPYLQPALIPFIYLNTHIHELSHAIGGLLTGATVGRIEVYSNGAGSTLVGGGSSFVVASAGYVGSSIVGAILLLWGGKRDGAKYAIWTAAIALLFSMIFFVRGDLVGVLSGIGWIAVLVWIAARFKPDAKRLAAQFLGIQICLTSLQAFMALMQASVIPNAHSDARLLEAATGISALTWALVWLGVSGLIIVLGLLEAWSPRRKIEEEWETTS